MAISTRSTAVFLLSAALLLQSGQSTSAMRQNHRKKEFSEVHCRLGMFDDRRHEVENDTQNCRPCSKCLPGYEASTLCGWYSDTECSPCPAGHYAATTSEVDGCIPCTKCGKHQAVSRVCTDMWDTICSPDCPHGFFHSPIDEDCLPCSSCLDHPQFEESSIRVEACETAGMDPDMQCWPLPTQMMGLDYSYFGFYSSSDLQPTDYESPRTTITFKDYHHRVTASQRPTKLRDPASDLDEDTARIYTVVLLTLLLVVALCVILSITVIVCLCRIMKMTSRSSRRNEKGGYQCISQKTSELLVREPTRV